MRHGHLAGTRLSDFITVETSFLLLFFFFFFFFFFVVVICLFIRLSAISMNNCL